MNDLDSAQYKIQPKAMRKEYDDFEDAISDMNNFTDVAVNTITDVQGYCGVASTKVVLDIDYNSRKAITTVCVYMEKDRDTEATPYSLNVGCN